ncbi:MAG TPA: DoxX family protein [Flavisolibacter sp.]|nr:DoxX family protein [Flavisolibacter sp.]
MKKLLRVDPASHATHIALLIARVATAVLMQPHGLPKFGMLAADPVEFADPFGLGATPSLLLSIFAEVVCSFFILIGLGTRLAVIPLIINMLVALIYVHGTDPFYKMELPLHFLMIYIVLLFTGSGKYSVDYLLQRREAKPGYRY